MAEKPPISDCYNLPIPQPLQDAVDEIAFNSPLVTETPADLDDNKKRWLVVGICLHSVIAPALRKCIIPILTDLYKELNSFHKIDTQIYPTHLKKYPPTNFILNYEAVNINKALYRYKKEKYDYTINNAVELSKLFQPTHMAQYTGFDETCETSGLLELVINIDKFAPDVRSEAGEVKRNLRNPWAHCDFTKWDAAKYSNAFKLMERLVLDMSLSSNEEKQIIGKLEQWKMNGEQFLGGTTVGLELVNEIRKQTCVLGEYTSKIATGTDDNFMKINNEVETIKILLINKIDQLKKDMEDIDKRVKDQDKMLKNQHTQLDSHNLKMELWKEQDVMFVETPVVEDISLTLESEHGVLVVGEPGIGKSMLMHHIALKLHSTINYNIIPCSTMRDIIDHYKEGIHQIFVLDDICGRFTASFDETEYLRKNAEILKKMLRKGKTKVASTCRLDIYSDENVNASCTVFTSNIINLSEEYSKENKLKIGSKYLTETNIQLLKDTNEVFTPLMCYLYSKNENFNLTDFLHCPYETYQNEWNKLKLIDPYKYCALFLCVLHNGSVNESLFDIYTENISSKNFVFENIFEICGLNRGTSRCKMETVFDSIIGTYVRKKSNEYSVIHDQMFDFMCGYFGNKDTMVRCILRDACIQFLNERTQLESINEQRRKFSILISQKFDQEYFMRIQNELQLGNLKECSRNPQMNHATYRAAFIKVLKSIDDKFLFEEIHPGTFSQKYNVSYFEFLITSCSRGYYDIVKFYVSKDADLENSAFYFTPLTAACEGGHEKIVQLLIDKGCYVNQIDGFRQTPLTTACEGGHETIVQLLIDKGSDVYQVGKIGRTPLTAACDGGNWKIVQLLIDKGCIVNQADRFGHTPLTVACARGHEKIVHLLIDNGSDVNQLNVYGLSPLTAARLGGNKKIVKLLMDKECYVNKFMLIVFGGNL
ncbi:Hypothetical predicted protein [Mytilus galloprovincialis]|uniref:Novel STAND NTPase 3 domain-containing protein n=1 Tax=Mytilus galloprovincialis TaxID=29158 RepID=A0A8B6EUS8_MYTGA|nr:Hypothetical predicted protein [Mytilus galloprovincialis]